MDQSQYTIELSGGAGSRSAFPHTGFPYLSRVTRTLQGNAEIVSAAIVSTETVTVVNQSNDKLKTRFKFVNKTRRRGYWILLKIYPESKGKLI